MKDLFIFIICYFVFDITAQIIWAVIYPFRSLLGGFPLQIIIFPFLIFYFIGKITEMAFKPTKKEFYRRMAWYFSLISLNNVVRIASKMPPIPYYDIALDMAIVIWLIYLYKSYKEKKEETPPDKIAPSNQV